MHLELAAFCISACAVELATVLLINYVVKWSRGSGQNRVVVEPGWSLSQGKSVKAAIMYFAGRSNCSCRITTRTASRLAGLSPIVGKPRGRVGTDKVLQQCAVIGEIGWAISGWSGTLARV